MAPIDHDPPEDYEVGPLRQALFDVYEALGFDCDGDKTPAGWCNLRKVVVNAAKEFAASYDELLDELNDEVDAIPIIHLASARAQLKGYADCCRIPLDEIPEGDSHTRKAWLANCAGIVSSNHPAFRGRRS